MSVGARAEWACEHMPCGSLLTGETSAPPHASLGGKYANSKGGGNQICWRYEVCAGGYTYDGKCDGTYIHSRDGARVPIGEVEIERGRILKHALQQHTRCMSAGARAEWACEHVPVAPSSRAKPQHVHPHASLGGICGLKRRRESKMLAIRGVRRGIYI